MSCKDDADEFEDDETYGVARKDFFSSINQERWASLFDPFLLPDGEKICLAWLYDATTKNFQQLGIDDLGDIDIIKKAIHEKLAELNFDFDEEEGSISQQKKLSTKSNSNCVAEGKGRSGSAKDPGGRRCGSTKVSPKEVASVEALDAGPDRIVTGLTDEDVLRREFRSNDRARVQDIEVDITISRDARYALQVPSEEEGEAGGRFSSLPVSLPYAPLRPLSREIARAHSPSQRKPLHAEKPDPQLKKEFDENAWGAISKTRGGSHHRKDKDSPPKHLSSVRPSSPSARPRTASSPDRRPASPSRRRSGTSTSEDSGQPMLYGEMVATFNLLQKQMGHLKADMLRDFKNEIGCEIVNVLLMGPRMSNMYLCIGGKWYTVPTEGSIAGYCAVTGETLNIPEVHADKRFNIDADCATGFVTKSMLCKPLLSRRDKSVFGVIELINKIKRADGHTFIIGTDSFCREDELACDLFVQKLTKEIDENFPSLYVSEALMDSFAKPISDAAGTASTPQYLKTTTAAEMNHAYHQTTNPHLSPSERDLYAEHQSTMLRLGTADAKMSAQEERDREIGTYLRGRHKRPESPSSPHKASGSLRRPNSPSASGRGGSPSSGRPQSPADPSILYPPLFPDHSKKKTASPIFKA